MHNKTKQIIRAVVSSLATAFFFTCLLITIFYITCGKTAEKYIIMINKFGVSYNNATVETKPVSFDSVAKKLKNYPRHGAVFAKIKIPKIGLDLDLYHGDSLNILRKGVGHYNGSLFPGEGGTVLVSAHNTEQFFARLPELKEGDEIIIDASYGKFVYKVNTYKVVNEYDLAKIPLKRNGEKLVLYTCYPIPNYGYTYDRYVVYAEGAGEKVE